MRDLIQTPDFANRLADFTIGFAVVVAAVIIFFILLGAYS